MAKAKKDKYPKNYTSKLSKTNRRVMYKLAGGWCLEVIRRLEGKTGSGEHLNCHSNVQDFVDRIGGERVEGWVKTPVPGTSKAGVTLWAFHSLWKTPEGELVDCTQSQHLLDEKTAIFWLDEKRSVDLEEGVGHGAVAVFERDEGIRGRETYNGKRLEKGKGYWMNDNSNPAFASFDDVDGRIRFLSDEYPKNQQLFFERYGIEIENGQLKPIAGQQRITLPVEASFEFLF